MDDSTKKADIESEEAVAETERDAVSDEVRRRRRQNVYRALLEAKRLEIIEVSGDLIM
jgi:heat shock protein HspQ